MIIFKLKERILNLEKIPNNCQADYMWKFHNDENSKLKQIVFI